MKKVLFWGLAALVLAGCSKNMDFTPPADYTKDTKDATVAQYESAFVQTFGIPGENQDWGFGSGSSSARAYTRSLLVLNDPFQSYNTESLYKSTAPNTAMTYEAYMSQDKWARQDWGGALDTNAAMQGDAEILLPAGSHTIKFTAGQHDFYVTGDATLNVPDYINAARIYVLPGKTFTLNMNNYINALEIYVAAGATLNYNYEKLYNQTGDAKIFNRGTLNLRKDNFEINQNAIVYNEGSISGKNITSKPGDGNPSYFYNYGDVELSGKFQLNSCANFYNEGTFTVAGETEITQGNSLIWWMNKGTYTTASFKTAAWNSTMYNFCSMFVTGDAYMQNGQFYQMNGSYMEVNRAVFNNFQFIMANGSGVNIKNGSLWGRDGADFRGKYDWPHQGFVAVDNAKAWVRLGGTNKVFDHKGSAFHVEGVNLTLGYEVMKFYSNTYYWDVNSFDNSFNNFHTESTAESLAAAGSENTTWDLHDVTKVYTGSDFAQVTATPKTGDCGATWTPNEGGGGGQVITYVKRVMAEDLSATEGSDFDFNDVVFDVAWTSTGAKIKLQAAGGTLPLYIGDTAPAHEVHAIFAAANPTLGITTADMINTRAQNGDPRMSFHKAFNNLAPVEFDLTGDFTENGENNANKIKIYVVKDGKTLELTAVKAQPASKFGCPITVDWADEFQNIDDKWPVKKFTNWVQGGANFWE